MASSGSISWASLPTTRRWAAPDKLRKAGDDWKRIVDSSPPQTSHWVRGSAGQPGHPAVERVGGLFQARLKAYRELMQMLTPVSMTDGEQRSTLANRDDGPLAAWYKKYGLLLSGDSLNRYLYLRELLASEEHDITPADLVQALDGACSALRTELKIDLGERHPDERDEPTQDGVARDEVS